MHTIFASTAYRRGIEGLTAATAGYEAMKRTALVVFAASVTLTACGRAENADAAAEPDTVILPQEPEEDSGTLNSESALAAQSTTASDESEAPH